MALAGCGSGSGSSSGSGRSASASVGPPRPGGTVLVTMKSLAFYPTLIHAQVGQRIAWRNDDSAPHNVTYVSGPRFVSSRPSMKPGTTFSLELTKSGTIHYYCSIHPWMTATIVVSP
jgi:plastocyanin